MVTVNVSLTNNMKIEGKNKFLYQVKLEVFDDKNEEMGYINVYCQYFQNDILTDIDLSRDFSLINDRMRNDVINQIGKTIENSSDLILEQYYSEGGE